MATIIIWSAVIIAFTSLDLYANYEKGAGFKTFTEMIRRWEGRSALRKLVVVVLLADLASHFVLNTDLIPFVGSS